MSLLDRYVAATFGRVFLGALLIVSVGVVTLDFFGRVGYFLEAESVEGTFAEGLSTFQLVAQFYAAYLPILLKEILPFVTLAAAMLTLSRMLRGNEVMPVVAAGRSARRLFLPLFVCGFLVAAGHLLFQEHVVPSLSREQVALKRFFSGDRSTAVEDMPHLRDGEGTVTRVRTFSFADRSLEGVVVQRPWTAAGFERWLAPRLEPRGDAWVAPAGATIEPAGADALPRPLPPGSEIDIGVTAAEVEALASRRGTEELSYSQIALLARKFPNRRHLVVALHRQVARPFSSFVLLLCGVPVLLSAGRAGFLGGAIAFALSAGYYFLDIFCTSLGDRGDLPAVFAAYFPLALLFSIGVSRLSVVPT